MDREGTTLLLVTCFAAGSLVGHPHAHWLHLRITSCVLNPLIPVMDTGTNGSFLNEERR